MMGTSVKNNWYPLQLWLTSVVFVAPVILIFISIFNNIGNAHNSFDFGVIVLFIVFGLVFSGPALLAI